MGDSILLTDNKYLVNALKRLNEEITVYDKKIPRFLIPTDFTPKAAIKRKYNWKDLADVDIKCSSNKIGEIINLAQMLNSAYWNKKSNNAPEEELFELYKDICQLDVLSCIEIDRCKKLSPVNAKKELDNIRKKNYLDKGYIIRNKQPKEVGIRPYFFKFLEGGKDYKFKKFNCGMDNLEIILDETFKRKNRVRKEYIKFTDIITKHSHRLTDRKKLLRLKNTIIEFNKEISYIHNSNIKNKWELYETIHNKYLEYIKSINITPDIIYAVLYRISKANEIDMFKEYKKIGKSFLNMLYEANKKAFLNYILENKENDNLIEDNDGKIDLYGLKFNKISKN